MTDANYRNKGLIREILQEIEYDYAEKFDGYFLFANASVLDFYPKFGFVKWDEYCYKKTIKNIDDASVERVPMRNICD